MSIPTSERLPHEIRATFPCVGSFFFRRAGCGERDHHDLISTGRRLRDGTHGHPAALWTQRGLCRGHRDGIDAGRCYSPVLFLGNARGGRDRRVPVKAHWPLVRMRALQVIAPKRIGEAAHCVAFPVRLGLDAAGMLRAWQSPSASLATPSRSRVHESQHAVASLTPTHRRRTQSWRIGWQ